MTDTVQPPATEEDSTPETVDEFEQLRKDIARQLRTNQRFLENFLDEDFPEEEEE